MLTEEALREAITRTSAELGQAEALLRSKIRKALEEKHLPSSALLADWYTAGYRKRGWRKAYHQLNKMPPRQALEAARAWAKERLESASRVNPRTVWSASVISCATTEYSRFLLETEEL